MIRKTILLADIPIGISLRGKHCPPVLSLYSTPLPARCSAEVTAEALSAAVPHYPVGESHEYIEFMELSLAVSDALIPFSRVLFHGTAFLWKEKAWIFSAHSGTGKTTQYLLWKLLFGDEIRILNGDKPFLSFQDNGRILVHSSPWMGKENMGQLASAPLGGIILLRQGQENHIQRIGAKEAAVPLFTQFMFSRLTPADVGAVCALEEQLLNTTPLWLLTNKGDEASARLCRNTLTKEVLS